MLRDRPVFVAVASGGCFTGPSPSGTPAQPDLVTPYLRAALGAVGLNDLAFTTVEGAARGPEPAERALASARGRLVQLIPVPPM